MSERNPRESADYKRKGCEYRCPVSLPLHAEHDTPVVMAAIPSSPMDFKLGRCDGFEEMAATKRMRYHRKEFRKRAAQTFFSGLSD